MEMTAREIKEFWREFCIRRKASDQVIERGEKKIDEDPEQWADRRMDELLELVSEAGPH